MKANWFSNRKFAWAVTVVLILAGVLLGGMRSAKKLKHEVDEVFEHGVGGDGYSIRHELTTAADEAQSILSLSGKYLSSDDVRLSAVSSALTAFRAAETPAEVYRTNAALYIETENLYRAVTALERLTDANKKQLTKWFGDIQEAQNRVRMNGYNDTARAFNEKIDCFPLSVFVRLAGVDEAELFA